MVPPWGNCRRRRLKGVTAELYEPKGAHTRNIPPSVCLLRSQPPSPRGRQVLSACFIFFRALFDYSTLFFKQLDLLFTVRTLPFTLILGSPLGDKVNCPQGQEKAPWGDCRRRRLKGATALFPPSVCSLRSQPPSPRGRQVLSDCFIFFRALFDYSTLSFR